MGARAIPMLAALLALAGCGSGDGQSGPGGVTANEARALDDAAEMIEKRRLPEDALKPPPPADSPASAAPAK